MTAITGKPAKIYTAYFSPTGGTKKAALALTSALADTDGFTEIDLSLPALAQYTFAAMISSLSPYRFSAAEFQLLHCSS